MRRVTAQLQHPDRTAVGAPFEARIYHVADAAAVAAMDAGVSTAPTDEVVCGADVPDLATRHYLEVTVTDDPDLDPVGTRFLLLRRLRVPARWGQRWQVSREAS